MKHLSKTLAAAGLTALLSSAAFAAQVERVRGTIDKAGGADLSVIIAPDSGTGALEGISGSFAITIEGGVHRYDLAYTLPTK